MLKFFSQTRFKKIESIGELKFSAKRSTCHFLKKHTNNPGHNKERIPMKKRMKIRLDGRQFFS